METGSKSKFLIFFTAKPADCCCFCFDPKTAVYILGTLDAVRSFMILCQVISLISSGYPWVDADISLCALPFAICGISGASKGDVSKLNLYSVFKQIYAVTIISNALLYTLVVCRDDCFRYVFAFMIAGFLEVYFAFAVWSAKERIVADFGSYTGFGKHTAELTPSGSSFPVVYSPPMPDSGQSKFMGN